MIIATPLLSMLHTVASYKCDCNCIDLQAMQHDWGAMLTLTPAADPTAIMGGVPLEQHGRQDRLVQGPSGHARKLASSSKASAAIDEDASYSLSSWQPSLWSP